MSNGAKSLAAASVMIALIVVLGAITVSAIVKYSVDDALKVWNAIDPLVTLVVGAGGTYWFTRKGTEEARKRADTLERLASKNNLI